MGKDPVSVGMAESPLGVIREAAKPCEDVLLCPAMPAGVLMMPCGLAVLVGGDMERVIELTYRPVVIVCSDIVSEEDKVLACTPGVLIMVIMLLERLIKIEAVVPIWGEGDNGDGIL